jgi:hypothetical protein
MLRSIPSRPRLIARQSLVLAPAASAAPEAGSTACPPRWPRVEAYPGRRRWTRIPARPAGQIVPASLLARALARMHYPQRVAPVPTRPITSMSRARLSSLTARHMSGPKTGPASRGAHHLDVNSQSLRARALSDAAGALAPQDASPRPKAPRGRPLDFSRPARASGCLTSVSPTLPPTSDPCLRQANHLPVKVRCRSRLRQPLQDAGVGYALPHTIQELVGAGLEPLQILLSQNVRIGQHKYNPFATFCQRPGTDGGTRRKTPWSPESWTTLEVFHSDSTILPDFP